MKQNRGQIRGSLDLDLVRLFEGSRFLVLLSVYVLFMVKFIKFIQIIECFEYYLFY